MSVFTTLMILIIVSSWAICLLAIERVFAYNRKYHLPESKYTRLFKVITKEYMAVLYVLVMIFYTFVTAWFLVTL